MHKFACFLFTNNLLSLDGKWVHLEQLYDILEEHDAVLTRNDCILSSICCSHRVGKKFTPVSPCLTLSLDYVLLTIFLCELKLI